MTELIISGTDEFPETLQLRPLIDNNTSFVAGGCFKNIFQNEPPKDIDVFFHNEDGFISTLNKFRDSKHYMQEYTTKRSVGFRHKTHEILIDLVRYQYGTPAEVLNRFDFTIVKFAYYMENHVYRVMYHPEFKKHLDEKLLFVDVMPDDVDLFFNRTFRYATYGFNVSLAIKELMFDRIRKLPEEKKLTNPIQQGS